MSRLANDLFAARCTDLKTQGSGVERTAFVRKVDDGLKIKGGEVKEAVLRELRLGPQSAVFLARSLQSSVIRVVDLYGNSLGDYGLMACLSLLRTAPTLRVLNFGANHIDKAGCTALAKELVTNRTLRVLNLGSLDGESVHNDFSDKAGITLLEALLRNSSLTALDANGTRLGVNRTTSMAWSMSSGPAGAGSGAVGGGAASNASSNWADTGNTAALAQSAMIDRLSTPIVREMGGRPINETSLTKLDKILATGPSNTIRSSAALMASSKLKTAKTKLSRGEKGDTAPSSSAAGTGMKSSTSGSTSAKDSDSLGLLLVRVLEENTTLRTLRLANNAWNHEIMHYFLQGLIANDTLTHLDIHSNRLGLENAMLMADLVGRESCCWSVLLAQNTQLGDGNVAMARALKINQSLVVLNLSATELDDSAAVALSDSLMYNATLTDLNISNNLVTELGCCALADSLQYNPIVRCLNLAGNRIKDEGAVALGHALQRNHTIASLDLSSCWIGEEGCITLADALAGSISLLKFRMTDNFVTEESGRIFAHALCEFNQVILVADLSGNQLDHSTLLRLSRLCQANQSRKAREVPEKLSKEIVRLEHESEKLSQAKKVLAARRAERQELHGHIRSLTSQVKMLDKELRGHQETFDERHAHEAELFLSTQGKVREAEVDLEKGKQAMEAEVASLMVELGKLQEKQEMSKDLLNKTNKNLESVTGGLDALEDQWAIRVKSTERDVEDSMERITELRHTLRLLQLYSTNMAVEGGASGKRGSSTGGKRMSKARRPGVAGNRRASPPPRRPRGTAASNG